MIFNVFLQFRNLPKSNINYRNPQYYQVYHKERESFYYIELIT